MTLLRRAIAAFLLLKLANLGVNLVAFPVLRAERTEGSRPSGVSLLVPVRDEADRLPATLPGLLAQHVDEIVFLDDGSTDGTAAVLSALTDERVRVIAGLGRPPGWAGKTWACQQLGDAATGDLLAFCDADVDLAPGAVDSIGVEMARQRADVFSVFPRQRTATFGEQLLVPLIDDVLLCFLPFPLLRAPAPSAATANGSVIAMRRTTFDALGGFGGVRGAVVEDVALARLTRRRGFTLGLALGGPLVATRMYSDWYSLVTGLARGVRPMVHGSSVRLGLAWLGHVVVYTLPLVLAGSRKWRLLLVLAVLERWGIEAKTGRRQWWTALLMPITPLAALPVIMRAMRPVQTWKGRSYS